MMKAFSHPNDKNKSVHRNVDETDCRKQEFKARYLSIKTSKICLPRLGSLAKHLFGELILKLLRMKESN